MPTAPTPIYTLCAHQNRASYYILRKDGAKADVPMSCVLDMINRYNSIDRYVNSEEFNPNHWGLVFKTTRRQLNLPEWF